jgi:hypothetical protein
MSRNNSTIDVQCANNQRPNPNKKTICSIYTHLQNLSLFELTSLYAQNKRPKTESVSLEMLTNKQHLNKSNT